jgi:hypothetical protein
MPSTPVQPPPVAGALYQTHPPGEPVKLDVLAAEAGPSEFHFHVAGADFKDLAPLIAPVVSGAQGLIYSMPPGLLNPNYWEPHTKESEAALRAAGSPVITRDDRGASWLWRPDSIAPGRYLRDGIDVPIEKLPGGGFKVAGADLLTLGTAWASMGFDPRDRFEWAAFKGSPAPDAQEDVAAFRLRAPGVAMIFSATGERQFRMAFQDRAPYRALGRAALRGFMMRCAGRVVSPPNDTVVDQFLARADRGLTSVPEKDFISKGTAFEFTARPGLSPWSTASNGDLGPDEEHILVYYDRVAGIWAVAS